MTQFLCPSTGSPSGAPVRVGLVQYLEYSKKVKYPGKFNELLQWFSLFPVNFTLFWYAWLLPSLNFICPSLFVLWSLPHLTWITFNSFLSSSYKTFSKEKCSREADGGVGSIDGWKMKTRWEWCIVYDRISGPPDTSSGWYCQSCFCLDSFNFRYCVKPAALNISFQRGAALELLCV